MNPEDLKVYAEFMKQHNLVYLEIRKKDLHIVLKRKGDKIEPIEEFPEKSFSSEEILEEAKEDVQEVGNFVYVKSPLVGTFYRAPSPESPPFVEVGSKVKKGDTLCIIEAMKVMNEIKSEHDGVVKEILVENGKPVEYGQVLFILTISQ